MAACRLQLWLHQIGLTNVSPHAVGKQHDGRMWQLLADVMVERGQIANHLAPAVAVGIVT